MAYLDPVNTVVALSAGAVLLAGTFYVLFGSPFDRKFNHSLLITGYYPGLYNLGNTCFLNAVLQAFASLPIFVRWVSNNKSEATPLLKSLHNVLMYLSKPADEEGNCNPDAVIHALQQHGWKIDLQQQDAHELYQVLMTTVQEELEHCSVGSLSDVIDLVKEPSTCRVHSRNGSINIPQRSHSNVFTGLLAGELMCVICGYRYPTKYEAFDCLSLTLPRGGADHVTLDTCLRHFVNPEPVKDVVCPLCSQHSNKPIKSTHSTFLKSLRIGKAPQCLVIQLKRTQWLPGAAHKLHTFVSFSDKLDVKPYLYSHVMKHALAPLPAEERGSSRLLYSLHAVAVHVGGADSGHYITYRKTRQSRWVYTSDTSVYPVPSHTVMSSEAYMLFYEMIK